MQLASLFLAIEDQSFRTVDDQNQKYQSETRNKAFETKHLKQNRAFETKQNQAELVCL